MDVGSGGGAPGIPLAAALPEREVTLLEANGRKCDFLARAGAEFPNARVVAGRAEEQPVDGVGVAVAKALAPPPVAAEWCLPLVGPGGAVVLWVGPSAEPSAVSPRGRRSSPAALGGARRRASSSCASSGRRRAGFPRRPGRQEASARLSSRCRRTLAVPGTIYALANQKGGVGKTTTAVNLAACLAEAGERALVVDLDPQANATSGLGERANGTSTLRPARRRAARARSPRATRFAEPRPRARRSPSSPARRSSSRGATTASATSPTRSEDARERYGFVFLDCPPSLGPLTVNALAAADRVLVPVQAEYYALEGLVAAARARSSSCARGSTRGSRSAASC